MVTMVVGPPSSSTLVPMAVTSPDTLACTGRLTKPFASPIFWPILTWSPTCTMGVAGAPMLMDMGISTLSGTYALMGNPVVEVLPSC